MGAANLYQHIKIRKGMGYDDEDIERLIFLASVAMGMDYADTQVSFFTECALAYNTNIGALHMLELSNRRHAFCFVLDKFKGNKGAHHIHLLSVFANNRGKGAGRVLLEHVLRDIGNEPITLEAFPASTPFFTKMGFLARPQKLEHGLTSMFLNSDGTHDVFQKVGYDSNVKKQYTEKFLEIGNFFNL
ncbi:MAG: hypothetical protein CML22_06705 [Rheinheimera sp.]|nr:hypothetical protein [Rheinheimera sp.]MBM33972.1 hypothetical protein [Rheinheimera sp.]|tara:strand:+ start:2193 stop:2756 length:564 start_codon:yes stop_codon:yes gene_type:complete